ncbi:MAG: LVIVD repeat-containing protein, partial [Pseudohongiellaceae bacterium]
ARRLEELEAEASASGNAPETPTDEEGDENADPRPALLSFSNTDLLFSGDYLIAGNYHGFNTYDISNPDSPEHIASVVCPGGQGDVSLVGDLMIMSVQEVRGRLDCGLEGVPESVSNDRVRGIRIFDVSDFRNPTQVAAVQTCRGSHTHTVAQEADENGNIYVYVSGTSRVRDDEELAGCSDDSPFENPESALFRIEVIEIPEDNPAEAKIVNRPFIFSDPDSGTLAGLWDGGDHGEGTQTTSQTNQCHDITTYPEIGLAAGACSGNGILLDISDPADPKRLDQVIDPGFAYWHSATFNNDGTKVIFTDEWGGGGRPRCRAQDPLTWGADAFYDIVEGKLEFRSHYKMSAPQTETENCVAHNGSLIPVPGRDIFVQAWYQGGVSVVDFTDSANPVEIAFFDRGPIDTEELITAGYWSTYWYNGRIYGTEISRGLDVFEMQPSDFLTENEIAAASLEALKGTVNAQTQEKIAWPAVPVVARAYQDQLLRTGAIDEAQSRELSEALNRAQRLLERGNSNRNAASELEALAGRFETSAQSLDGITAKRYLELAGTVAGIADAVR